MRVLALVRRELLVLVRSPGLWLTMACFAGVLTVGALLPAIAFSDPDPRLGAAFLLGPATDILLPAIAIMFGHGAVANRRETGELKQLLAMPYRRSELLLGVWVGRVLAVASIVAMGSVPAVLAVRIGYGDLNLGSTAWFVLATAAAGGTYTAIAVAVSAVVRTQLRALGVLLGSYVVAYALWEPIVEGITLATDPRWATWLDRLEAVNPLEAYSTIANVFLPAAPRVQLAFADGTLAAEQGTVVGAVTPSVSTLALPIGVMVVWTALPLLLAIVRFRRVDLD